MRARITAHGARRPAEWTVVEALICLADALRAAASPSGIVVIECLTLWLANLLSSPRAADLEPQRNALLETVASLAGDQVFVSNEVGQGVIPVNALARRFADEAGQDRKSTRLNSSHLVISYAVFCLKKKKYLM